MYFTPRRTKRREARFLFFLALPLNAAMAGLVSAIQPNFQEELDGRLKGGHDGFWDRNATVKQCTARFAPSLHFALLLDTLSSILARFSKCRIILHPLFSPCHDLRAAWCGRDEGPWRATKNLKFLPAILGKQSNAETATKPHFRDSRQSTSCTWSKCLK
jgi:hypothetical protein